jgi:hypothetical protein
MLLTPDVKVELPKTRKKLKIIKDLKKKQTKEVLQARAKLEEIKRNAPVESVEYYYSETDSKPGSRLMTSGKKQVGLEPVLEVCQPT